MPTRWCETIASELDLLDKEIRSRVKSDDSELNDVVDYILYPGGKRIRPAVVILSYLASGGKDVRKVIPLAAAIELIHSGTLVHDDMNDTGSMRRGKLATHLKYGDLKAIVAGDYLFVKAYDIGSEYPPIVMKLTAEICSKLAEGEFAQNRHLQDFKTDESDYLAIVKKKTALPLSLAARVGALIAKGGLEEPLGQYGYNIGIAFQISDDILDVAGDMKITKKTTALDIRLGSPNILIIRALETSPRKEEMLALLTRPIPEVKRAKAMILGTDALAYARKKAENYAAKAKRAIDGIPRNRYLEAMDDMADFITKRNE